MINLTARFAKYKNAKVAKTWCSLRLLLSALCGYKNGIVILIYVITALPLAGQPNITNAEYFFDVDPGVGSATPLSFTLGQTSFDITPSLTQALAAGTHTLSVRAKDATGVWGFAERRQFFILSSTSSDPPTADITAMEYFVDVDPGFGSATPIVITTGSLVDIPSEIISASALPAGFHTVVIRSKNTYGIWGFAEKREFYIIPPGTASDPPPADIQTLEYFFDVDPGFGSATAITISTGQLIDINTLIPESLASGLHTISIRAKNVDGAWGLSDSRPVYIKSSVSGAPIPDITKIEYYFDGADPGIGNAIDLPITPGQIIDLNTVDVPTSPSLIDGQHFITFRAMNADNVWGMAEIDTFDILDDCNQPVVDFSYQLACAGEPVQFIDNSTTIQPDAQYRWYFNGDNV
ncbi:MAG: hypothetical protein IIB82_15235, partial [Bacteroidetes bacterium]|nr:hypothetical protein [Bacteroidota bacterium]